VLLEAHEADLRSAVMVAAVPCSIKFEEPLLADLAPMRTSASPRPRAALRTRARQQTINGENRPTADGEDHET